MTDFGVTPQGFVRKPREAILSSMGDNLLATFGQEFNLEPSTPEGLFIGILAGELDTAWAVMQAVYGSFDPSQAGDASLDNIGRISGVLRHGAVPAASLLTLVGNKGVRIPAGRLVSAQGITPKVTFRTLVAGDLASLPDYYFAFPSQGQSYQVVSGMLITYLGNVYVAVGSGPNGSIPPVNTDGSDSVDGFISWRYVGIGDSSAQVMSESIIAGDVSVPAYSLTVIETPVDGWGGVINPAIPAPGRAAEMDPDYRLRREVELRKTGLGTWEAVRRYVGDVRNVPDVDSVQVFENRTDFAVGSATPHSMEVMVHNGLDADVANAIWKSKPLGTALIGSTTVVITDEDGNPQTIKFTRPSEVPIYVNIDIVIDPLFYPIDGDAQVIDAVIAAARDRFGIGDTIVPTSLYGAVVGANGIPGVIHVSAFTVSTYGGLPQSGLLTMDQRWLPVWDLTRFVINHVQG